MKNLFYLIILLITLTACSDKYTLQINNSTNNEITATINDQQHNIAGRRSIRIDLGDGNNYSPFYTSQKRFDLKLIGETFAITTSAGQSIEDVVIDVQAGQIYPVYCHPNRGAIRFVNNSNYEIIAIQKKKYIYNENPATTPVYLENSIEIGESFLLHITEYAQENNGLSYAFELTDSYTEPQYIEVFENVIVRLDEIIILECN